MFKASRLEEVLARLCFVCVGSVERACVAKMFVGCPVRSPLSNKFAAAPAHCRINRKRSEIENVQWQLTATTSLEIAATERRVLMNGDHFQC